MHMKHILIALTLTLATPANALFGVGVDKCGGTGENPDHDKGDRSPATDYSPREKND